MPLEDLIDLGYEVKRSEDEGPLQASVVGHGRQWSMVKDQEGESIVVREPAQWNVAATDEEAAVAEARNHHALLTKLDQAHEYFADNYANWASMTAPQKDTAARNAQRALANLIRHVRNDLTSEGV